VLLSGIQRISPVSRRTVERIAALAAKRGKV
jgi:hypothetical protein